MAITFNGCGSRVVLCTWAHVFAILDPHSLALLTMCCSLYFGIQVDVWHGVEDKSTRHLALLVLAPEGEGILGHALCHHVGRVVAGRDGE